jgi:hypothetical protein
LEAPDWVWINAPEEAAEAEVVVAAVAVIAEAGVEAVAGATGAEVILEEAEVAQVETLLRDQALDTCQALVSLPLGLLPINLVSVEPSVSPLLFLVLVERGRGSVRALVSVDPGLELLLGLE